MSEFWIFLAIAGAIITFAKRENKGRRRKQGDATSIPQSTPQTDLERQLKELFGEETTTTQQSVPKFVTPLVIKPAEQTPTSSPYKKPIAKQESKPAIAEDKSKEESNNNITEILDDFTMEKAVIYAEILRPKFEEY